MRLRQIVAPMALLLCAATAAAEPHVIRLSSVAPEGTGWARLLRSFTRDVESATGGDVKVKWYLGGIAGDEVRVLERIRRDQLDGAALAIVCD